MPFLNVSRLAFLFLISVENRFDDCGVFRTSPAKVSTYFAPGNTLDINFNDLVPLLFGNNAVGGVGGCSVAVASSASCGVSGVSTRSSETLV
jgi:hypothetical protein